MAEIIGGFCMPHDPMITGSPEMVNDQKQVENINAAFATIARRLKEMEADTALVFADDHYVMFGPDCVPRYLIAIGDVEGPIEGPWMRIPRQILPNDVPLAEHIMQYGFDSGFDWAVAKTLVIDHGAMLPIALTVVPNPGMMAIPIYLSTTVTPLLTSKRAFELGRMIGRAVEAFPEDRRVVVFGTGGISHWVGDEQMTRVNPEFDYRILEMTEKGDIEGLLAIEDAYYLEHGGNGSLEIKNWICAMAAMSSVKGKTICYEPVPELITGLGFVELQKAA